MSPPSRRSGPLRTAVIGAGCIGSFHARTVAERVPNFSLVAVVDPDDGAARRVAEPYGASAHADVAAVLADVDAVVISSPATTHADLVAAAAGAGVAVFVEKPMSLSLEDADRAITAAQRAGVPLQVGFNRRFAPDFAAAHRQVSEGAVGTPQLLRSLTRDPALVDPGRIGPWVIFTETLIHDFDFLNWMNAGARPVEVHAMADALVAPEYRESGLLDTAVVTIRYDNGALAVAEASFQAVYGYDVRGEVFGSGGMVTVGDVRSSSTRTFGPAGAAAETTRSNVDLFADAYTEELHAFARAARTGEGAHPSGDDARAALVIALACIDSVRERRAVTIGADGSRS